MCLRLLDGPLRRPRCFVVAGEAQQNVAQGEQAGAGGPGVGTAFEDAIKQAKQEIREGR